MSITKRLGRLWFKTLLNTICKFATSPLGAPNQVVFPMGAVTQQLLAALLAGPTVSITAASGAIPQPPSASSTPRLPGKYIINYNAGAGAYTLAAPTAGIDDGVCLQIFNNTAHAHTITTPAAGDIVDGNTSNHNTVWTFNANKGGCLTIEAYQGVWYAIGEIGGSLSS